MFFCLHPWCTTKFESILGSGGALEPDRPTGAIPPPLTGCLGSRNLPNFAKPNIPPMQRTEEASCLSGVLSLYECPACVVHTVPATQLSIRIASDSHVDLGHSTLYLPGSSLSFSGLWSAQQSNEGGGDPRAPPLCLCSSILPQEWDPLCP